MNVVFTFVNRLPLRSARPMAYTPLFFLSIILLLFYSNGGYAQENSLNKDAWKLATTQSSLMLENMKQIRQKDENLVAPRTLSDKGELVSVKSTDWTSGFFAGTLWFLYEHTGDKKWLSQAKEATVLIAPEQYNGRTHDMGFKIYCSVGSGYRLTADPAYREIIIQSAQTLSKRFNPTTGCIRSWDHNQDKWDFPVIIDNMLNLELLFAATELTGDSSFYKIAVSHANTTMKNHFRADYSTFHVIDYDPSTGAVQKRNTHQGYSDNSTWARGQAWALYGYTMCYRETGDSAYLELAEHVASWLFNHPHMPEDLIPYWDFDAPNIPDEPRDVSAAAVIASALFELSSYSGNHGHDYLRKASRMVETLTEDYSSNPGENKGFVLLHSTGSKPSLTEVDKPLSYADYYFLEALLRKENLDNKTVQSKLLSLDPQKKEILYFPDEKGNVIPNFSRVGYHQGTTSIPQAKVEVVLEPSNSGNDQSRIQQAIDQVSQRTPNSEGLRGAVLLKRGKYYVPTSLRITQSGVVLRGEGDQGDGTVVIAKGKGQRSLVSVRGKGGYKMQQDLKKVIADSFVPVGALCFRVEDTKGLQVDMPIILKYPVTADWVQSIKMDQIKEREGTKQWRASEYQLEFERRITGIRGDTVFVDNPVVMAIDQRFGGANICPFQFEGRIREVGVENIRFESEYVNDTDEDHAWIAVDMDKVENGWVDRITTRFFGYAAVSLGAFAKQVSVLNSKCLDAKSIITGGRRYSFNNNGQLNLFKDLYTSNGRHDFVTGARALGPNVFTACEAQNTHADIGPHHRWAVGTLYDCVSTDGEINVQDRGNWGSGHGWAGVTQVLWNCQAKGLAVQSPWDAGKNYSIGSSGERLSGRIPDRPAGYWEASNQRMSIPSLYGSQLRRSRQ